MGKKLLCLGLVLSLIFCFAACDKSNDEFHAPPPPEYSTENNFLEDEVLVLLTVQASFERIFHDYTPEDFPEVNAIAVEPLDDSSLDLIRQYLSEDPSGATLPEQLKDHKRGFVIRLAEKDKENVLQAIEILSQRDDVSAAGPNIIFTIH